MATALPFALFVAAIMCRGVPSLRHDWSWHASRAGYAATLLSGMSGWEEQGFGSINFHIEGYLLAPILAALGYVAGPFVSLLTEIALIGTAALFLVRVLIPSPGAVLPRFSVLSLILLNPWCYNEVVAGHLSMVLAAMGLFGVTLAALGRLRDDVAIVLFICAASLQIQFSLLATPLVVMAALYRRKTFALILWPLVNSPTLAGILINQHALLDIPFNLTWQASNSVPATSAVLLSGYAPDYAARGGLPLTLAIALFAATALLGLKQLEAKKIALAAVIFLAVLLFTSGTRGSLAPLYDFAVTHFKAMGLFRELYDLVALLLVLYALLCARVTSRSVVASCIVTVAALLLCWSWTFKGPSQLWVSQQSFPAIAVHQSHETRFLLLPAFQPLTFNGRGSGADPDAYYRTGDIIPLNEYLPTYPAATAVARFEAAREVSDVAALGVTAIYRRPWFRSAQPLEQGQLRVTKGAIDDGPVLRGAVPLLSAWPLPALTSRAPAMGENDVFYGDVLQSRLRARFSVTDSTVAPSRVEAPVKDVDPRISWIDATLGFVTWPDIGEPFGGALTMSRTLLPISGRFVLAYVQGRLVGAVPMERAPGYTWYAVTAAALQCVGFCVVALQSDGPPPQMDAPVMSAHDSDYSDVQFTRILPFVIVARCPSRPVLRLNESFDRGWAAVSKWQFLPHFRIAGVANAWLLGPDASGCGTNVAIIQRTALLQAVLELLSGISVIAAITFSLLHVNSRELACVFHSK